MEKFIDRRKGCGSQYIVCYVQNLENCAKMRCVDFKTLNVLLFDVTKTRSGHG